jgi:Squalene-hopene cyclase C-terminal domain
MRSLILMLTGWICIHSTGRAQSSPTATSEIQQTVQRAVHWLESDMVSWQEKRQCAACHHGPLYLWSMNVAKQRGYHVNSAQLEQLAHWLIDSEEARVFPREKTTKQTASSGSPAMADRMTEKMMGAKNLSQPTIYMLPAVLSMSPHEPLRETGWRKLVEHLATAQQSDGSFVGRDAWRPIFNTPSVLTLQVAYGLTLAESQLADRESQSVNAAALKYLAEHPIDESQQSVIYQILLPTEVDKTPGSQNTDNKVQRLIKMQRGDGGWAQTDDRPSDAFATGQALFALHRAGLDVKHPSIAAAMAFLVNSQQKDGTWLMTSRPNPEDGQPATNLNPITYAATAWATLGMASHVSGMNPSDNF